VGDDNYNELSMGYPSNISGMKYKIYKSRSFANRLLNFNAEAMMKKIDERLTKNA
jgi:RNase H-fold protein (predicted Holliday junction resolvase)